MVRPLIFATANNSILEAMSMGKTVLASRIPGITDYLNDTNCIFIDTMKDLSLENVWSGRPSPAAVREFTVREFSWRTVLNAYLQLYNQRS
jgi:glycosyltransferase involved in cell wall biosynthesis